MSPPRQTAFPGILVESISVQKPPFDEQGIVQEFVGRGATREFDALQRASNVTPSKVEDAIDSLEELIGPLQDTYRVRYNLLIRTFPGEKVIGSRPAGPLQRRSVRIRARWFTRAKNPFEPDILEVGDPSVDSRLSSDSGFTVYRVPTWVTK